MRCMFIWISSSLGRRPAELCTVSPVPESWETGVLEEVTVQVRLVPAIAALSLFSGGCYFTSSQKSFEPNIPPGEDAQIAEITDLTPEMQGKRKSIQRGVVLRGVHPKSHGCVSAEFRVNKNLEERFRVGLFASPGKAFNAKIRFSNAEVHTGDDLAVGLSGGRENGSRGMAVKVRNVGGEVFDADEGDNNQDFLMINTPEFAFRNSQDYLRLSRILHASENSLSPAKYFVPAKDEKDDVEVTTGIDASKRVIFGPHGIKSKTVRNPLQARYFGAAPFLFGKGRAMRFSAEPCGGEITQEPLTKREKETLPKNFLRAALTETMKGNKDVCFDFKIQVRDNKDVKDLKIEDATTKWDNELGNYKSVAQIIIKAPQQADTREAIEQCEALAYTPWHSLIEHRPLGSINRLRRDVYTISSHHRLGAQPTKP